MASAPTGVVAALVGRDDERRRVDAFVERVHSAPRSMVIVGEAGIGKTTLWSYGVDACRHAGITTLIAHPTEEDRSAPASGRADLFDVKQVSHVDGIEQAGADHGLVRGLVARLRSHPRVTRSPGRRSDVDGPGPRGLTGPVEPAVDFRRFDRPLTGP